MAEDNTRRRFLKMAGQGLLAAPVASSLLSCSTAGSATQAQAGAGKASATSTLGKPNVTLNVRDFGATGNGSTKDTVAIQQALDRCWVLGGGEVVIPAGNYLTGAIALKSNTLLRFEKDAVLLGTPDFADYPVMQVRWEGKWIQGHVGLIYAISANNIGVVGPGKIMGHHDLGGRPTAENPLRHPALIEPIGCNNLRFEDFSTDYFRMWCLHPTYCENIVIKNLTIRSTGGNGDGIDIDSCKHVRIEGCDINTGDDCISLKSGRGMEGYSLLHTTEDVHISNCTFADSIFACIGIGSETSGGIRNVRIEHCKFTFAQTHAIYIKTRPGRGAFIEDIIVDDIDVSGTVAGFLRFNMLGSGIQDQSPVPGDEGIPTVKNWQFSNIRVKDVPVLIDGTAVHPNKPLDGFSFVNVTGTCAKGIALANIKKAKLRDIKVTGFSGPLLSIYNVTGSGLEGAATIEPPKLPDPVPTPNQPYKLG
ncbi:glycoside hydrolase family 28 protein [Hymenobacter sp. GOD-10R]|uniref:glycoside hydrolase family 28 protein n=1 Tax=Hymenobacter sp. GOD-10R TaxID=3093922 RepID=UPI002D78CE4B|nr:glycosyl hydrolase family 28 protein [Hymenobacter sp. GOD-10R]WRQ27637.1 glycosyl hydrolase family 28 protein [Hymenobacter sp. GOD-10R]